MKPAITLLILSLLFLGFVSVHCERSDHRCGDSVGNPPCENGRCCSRSGWCGNSASYCRQGSCAYQCWTVLSKEANRHDDVYGDIMSEPLFNEMFKHRGDCPSGGFYSYEAFVDAASSFPGFVTTGDVATRKRELAAFLALISRATEGEIRSDSVDAHSYGLCHVNTTSMIESEKDYCTSPHWPCSPGLKYSSRGPIQLSQNSNYGRAGEALELDLINDPDLVATDAVVSFKTALWFWMAQHDVDKPSFHDLLTRSSHFHGENNILKRSTGYYRRYCEMLKVSPNFLEPSRIRMTVL